MKCADGYQPQIIENEAPVYSDYFGTPYNYFTCCPPTNRTLHTNASRHCSNSTAISVNDTMSCEANKHQHNLRRMKNHTWFSVVVESYLCCDSNVSIKENQTTHFLNDNEIKCVPYHNKNYETITGNCYGNIYGISCSKPEIGFEYVNDDGHCCKKQQKPKHFIQDSQFYSTVYPQLILSSIAVIACTVLIVALLIPLWLHWRVKLAVMNVSSTANRATFRRLKQAAAASTYSSYNLYLVFLALPDFLLNLYLLGMNGSYLNQQFKFSFHGATIVISDYDFHKNNGSDNSFGTFCNRSLHHYYP